MKKINSYLASAWLLALPLALQAGPCRPKSSVDLERLTQEIFYQPSDNTGYKSYEQLKSEYAKASPARIEEMRRLLKSEAGYAVEPLPLVISKEIWEQLKQAAEQRALAANRFLQDVYRNKDSDFLKAHPEFRPTLESSPMFAHEIVGSAATLRNPFNLTLAMDIVLIRNPDGTFGFAILEADSGNIGGSSRMPLLAEGLARAWRGIDLSADFLDARTSLFERMDRHREAAEALGGKSLFFNEMEAAFDAKNSPVALKWLADRGILNASNWNKDRLRFDPVSKRYYFEGHPITDFWLEYNTESLDPLSPVYKRIPEATKTDPHELSHALPGFWENWLNGGYSRWIQHNPQGIEIFSDKAISAVIPLAEKLYLGKDPILGKNTYSNILQSTRKKTNRFIHQIFADQDNTVIKSRRDSGQGMGVYIGRFMKDGKTKNNLNWNQLKNLVTENPVDWVYQSFMQEEPLVLQDGRVRTFELRLITHVENGQAHVMDAVYIRSSAVGTMRNMSGTKDLNDLNAPSIIPVLIPR